MMDNNVKLTSFYQLKYGAIHTSGYTSYPDKYLIYGAGFMLNSEVDEIYRSTKSVGDALGGIGGTAYSL